MRLSIGEIKRYLGYLAWANALAESKAETTDRSTANADAGRICNRLYFQLPCSAATRELRRRYLLDKGWQEKKIVLMGDDDLLALELAAHDFSSVWVDDCDASVLDSIARETRGARFPPILRKSDFTKASYEAPCRADVVCLDPPYNARWIQIFIDAAYKAFAEQASGHLILMVNPHCLKAVEWAETQERLHASGWHLRQHIRGFNLYPIAPPGSWALRLIFFLSSPHIRRKGWRRGTVSFASDLFHFEKTAIPCANGADDEVR